MDINELQFPPPQYWQQFEELCLAIFRGVWNDPTAQKNGRGGQPQHGTDVSGYAGNDNSDLHGVQCKGKEINYGGAVSETELHDEIEKAKSFTPPLRHWILATTAPKDAKIEAIARKISAQHEAQGLFRVQVYGWEDLQSLIRRDQNIVKQFYPEFDPVLRRAALRFGELLERRAPTDQTAFNAAHRAAEADLEKHFQANGLTSQVLLDLEEGNEQIQDRYKLMSDLRQGGKFVLEAGPGAGKSTALLQIARQALAETADIIPLFIPLPEFAESQHDLLEEVSSRSSFRAFDSAVLGRLAGDGAIIAFCDGWNELPVNKRASVRRRVNKFRRDYPRCGLFFSTRSLTPSPIEGAATFRLAPPTRTQQLAILEEKIGDQAEELLNKVRRTPGLSGLARTPLYLVVLATIGQDGSLPETKDEAVRRFIEKQEQGNEHGDALRNVLYGRHESYLRAIALGLMKENAVTISETALRITVAQVSERLATGGQISEKPQPTDIIDALVSHHTLVERADRDGEPLYSFQHPQFQEWYASFFVEDCIAAAHENPTKENKTRLDGILNDVGWSEPIMFAIERLSRRSVAGKVQCVRAISRTLAIDPMLGASMIRRASSATWESVEDKVVRFATAWYEGPESRRALRFMIGTGRPEFSKYVWKAYENEERADAIVHMPYGWFGAESLGASRVARYLQLPSEQRRSLLYDLVHRGGQTGIEFAIDACRKEPEAKHVGEILELLWHGGASSEFYALLKTANADVWKELARRHPLSDVAGEFRTQLLEAKRSSLAEVDGAEKLSLLLELAEAGETGDPNQAIDILLGLEMRDYQREAQLFERTIALYSQQLTSEILRRVKAGENLSSVASRYVVTAPPQDQESLIAKLANERPPDRREVVALGRALDRDSAEKLIRELFSIRAKFSAIESRAGRQVLQLRYQTISDALQLMKPDALAAALIHIPVKQAHEIAIASELLYRWHGDDLSDLGKSLDPETLDRLRETVKGWVYTIVPRAQGNRNCLADLASAIKVVSAPGLLIPLKALLDAELAAWRDERDERERLHAQGQSSSWANMSYTQIYRQAFASFEGEAVRDNLLQYLGNRDFEVEAAFELIRFGAEGQRPELTSQLGAPKYERVARARVDRKNIPPTNPVAAAVLDRIDQLMTAGNSEDHWRAIKMATAAIQMQTGERVSSIRAVMALPAPLAGLCGLLETAMLVGEKVDSKILVRGFNEAVANAEDKNWRWSNEWWHFAQWLRLLALSDDPEQIATCLANLPRQIFHIYDLDGIVNALGYGEPEKALQALKLLSVDVPGLAQRHYFSDALLRLGTEEAIKYLVNLVLEPPGGKAPELNHLVLADQLADACQSYPSIKEELVRRFSQASDRRWASLFHYYLFPRIVEPSEIIPLLRRCGLTEGDYRFQLLRETVRSLAVVDRPLSAANTYERESQDLASLRADLFQINESKDPYAELAGRLLLAIEEQRDEYGRPPTEPRHPDIKSSKPWPRVAALVAQDE